MTSERWEAIRRVAKLCVEPVTFARQRVKGMSQQQVEALIADLEAKWRAVVQ